MKHTEKADVVVVCRGEGVAVPARNSRLITALQRALPSSRIEILSYGPGASGLVLCGHQVDDLELGLDPVPWDLMAKLGPKLRDARPKLVISIGEFVAVPVCNILGVRCVFITDWLPKAGLLPALALKHAESVVVLDDPGSWEVPPYLDRKVHFEGPVIREIKGVGRNVAAGSPGFADGARVGLIYDADAPRQDAASEFFELAADACRTLHEQIRIASIDWYDRSPDPAFLPPTSTGGIAVRDKRRGDFDIRPDVVLVTNTRLNVLECAWQGIRTISLGMAGNGIDDERIARIHGNTVLKWPGATPAIFAVCLRQALADGVLPPGRESEMVRRVDAVVARALASL